MSSVIRVENLGKRYLLSHQSERQPYLALRDVISDGVRNLGRRLTGHQGGTPQKEEFWALRDVSFEVNQGDRVGIIGRNGAGKSTLLKILSRITEPTTGRVTIRGRVASLLEVGTGFHPELTGRENIFLNGAILGMSRAEIKRKFDEIVDFAEIEKFLDTPVKRYSSGMYVRLAFAVAAHLEPEILVVDEVLAVGDAQFQKKCLGKMEEVSVRGGKTVLFVSHNMGLIGQLCSRGVLLEAGDMVLDGEISEVICRYLATGVVCDNSDIDLTNHPNRLKGMKRIMKHLSLMDISGKPATVFRQEDTIAFQMQYDTDRNTNLAGSGFTLTTLSGIRVGGGNTYMGLMPPHRLPEKGNVTFYLPANQLTPGIYSITMSVGSHQSKLEDKIENIVNLEILQSDIYGTGYLLTPDDGVMAMKFEVKVSESC